MAKYQDTHGYKAATEAQRLNFGCRQTILIESERIKRQTIANRPLLHRTIKTARARGSLYFKPPPVPIILTTDNLYPAPFGGAPGLISIVLALFATSEGFLMLR